MEFIQTIELVAAILSGGIVVKIYERYFPSKKDENTFQVDLMEEVRKYALDIFSRIAQVESELRESKLKNEKLQREYDELNRKYIALKRDFEALKSKS